MGRTTVYSRARRDPPETLLNFLAKTFKYHTKDAWEVIIRDAGLVQVGGSLCRDPGYVLRQQDRITYSPPAALEPEVNRNFKILYLDNTIVVVDKPANLPVSEGGRYSQHTLTALLGPLLREPTQPEENCTSSDLVTHGLIDGERHKRFQNDGGSKQEASACANGAIRVKSNDSTHITSNSRRNNKNSIANQSTKVQVYAVHRLDRDTSGLVVLARTRLAAARLGEQFARHAAAIAFDDDGFNVSSVNNDAVKGSCAIQVAQEVKDGADKRATVMKRDREMEAGEMGLHSRVCKEYEVVLVGHLNVNHAEPHLSCNLNIGRAAEETEADSASLVQHDVPHPFVCHASKGDITKLRMATYPPGGPRGKAARTDFIPLLLSSQRLQPNNESRLPPPLTLARVILHTGRTHQIRVHAAALGHPVAGERLYTVSRDGRPGRVGAVSAEEYLKRARTGEALSITASLGTAGTMEDQTEVIIQSTRHLLHASKLEFSHPLTNERLVFYSSGFDTFACECPQLLQVFGEKCERGPPMPNE